jgi:hypothetical protein
MFGCYAEGYGCRLRGARDGKRRVKVSEAKDSATWRQPLGVRRLAAALGAPRPEAGFRPESGSRLTKHSMFACLTVTLSERGT